MKLVTGIYEQVINCGLEKELKKDGQLLFFEDGKMDVASANKVLSDYMRKVLRQAFSYIGHSDHAALVNKIEICNKIIELLSTEIQDTDLLDLTVHDEAKMLYEVFAKMNNSKAISGKKALRPLTPLVESSLFTGGQHEPKLYLELKKEISTANTVDILVSFIKWSGLSLIYEELVELTKECQLRVITTSYMGATDLKAVQKLATLPNTQVKISYDTKRTRLHAKSYLFNRDTGFSTAYIGSSNMSNAAMSDGLEWNVKVSEYDSIDMIRTIRATFETYWQSKEFEDFEFEKLKTALLIEKTPDYSGANQYFFEIRPYPYQQEILDRLWAERNMYGRYKNLVVAATGTGKTVMAAFDYLKFHSEHPSCHRLLFVAHREEILEQSVRCFRQIVRDNNFGDLCVGAHQFSQIDHLFISVQSFNAKKIADVTTPDFYDFIIIDEIHHGTATTYQRILEHYKPKILLGLTATPERMDGQDIVQYFDNHIAAELRLCEAINRQLLCPFHYFGVKDDVDLSELTWSRGGYDSRELENLYTADTKRVDLIIRAMKRYGDALNKMVGLGFCVSVKHAHFMADMFNRYGIESIALDGTTTDSIRGDARKKLAIGTIQFIFTVDLFNEGIDIPNINTVLLLRPTESVTVFLQQIGRGLRLADGKDCLTVLDFIGQSHVKFSFEERYTALLGRTKQPLEKEIEQGFPNIPRACYLYLEEKAQSVILKNIHDSLLNQSKLIKRIQSFDDKEQPLTLESFLELHHLTTKNIYKKSSNPRSWSRLCQLAGKKALFQEPLEKELSMALQRLQFFNSISGLGTLKKLLVHHDWQLDSLSADEYQVLLMFYYTVWGKSLPEMGFIDLKQVIDTIWENPMMCAEIVDLINLLEKNNYIQFRKAKLNFPCELEVYAQYTRDQILSALGYYTESKIKSHREGILFIKEKKVDAFFITLKKSEKAYSPSTMYEDYVMSEELFHWQSQSVTTASSETGKRYTEHKQRGHKILLFVREEKTVNGFTAPYVFLGTAEYQSHIGSKPMSIVWKLDMPIPAYFVQRWIEVGA